MGKKRKVILDSDVVSELHIKSIECDVLNSIIKQLETMHGNVNNLKEKPTFKGMVDKYNEAMISFEEMKRKIIASVEANNDFKILNYNINYDTNILACEVL